MAKLTPQVTDKLIVALSLEDVVAGINTALRARKAVLTLDYEDGKHPKLVISMPGTKPEPWLIADARTKRCVGRWPADKNLALTVQDIMDRLKKQDAHLAIGCQRRPNQKVEAKLQVFVTGSNRIAITLFSVRRGERKSQEHFLLPKAIA